MRATIVLLPVILLAGCTPPDATSPAAATAPAAAPAPAPAPAASAVIGTPAPGSKFSRIQIGMGKTQIQDIIGPPTDSHAHDTGKEFIPFYFGGDTTEIDAHYKGEGILTYASRRMGDTAYVLLRMKVDPTEQGYVQ